MKPRTTAFFFSVMLFFALQPTAHAELKIKYFALPEGRIAFTYIQGGQHDIHVLDFKTLKITPLVTSPAVDEFPSWSPDGTKIAFYSDMDGDREIYTINADGSELTRLTKSKGMDEDPHWSPDGTKIVFHSARLGKGQNVHIMNADGTNPVAITNNSSSNTVPKWSPRGTEILYSTNKYWPGWDLILYDFATKKSKVLTSGFRSYCRGSWHPDGSVFAFSYGASKDIDIWIQEKGFKPKRITELPGREYDAVWSDDGKNIFFVHELGKGEGNYQLYVVNLDTMAANQITEGDGAIRYPSWTSMPTLEFFDPQQISRTAQELK